MILENPLIQKKVLTVSEITRDIKRNLEGKFSSIQVDGEISNFMAARSGHWYFKLKDSGAELPCVMFKGNNRLVVKKPKDGSQVLVHGRINVYEPRGSYQLVVDSMQEVGEGKLREQFEVLKQKLEKMGLFDQELKRPLPFLPKRIALVTSSEGAAVRDMIRVITRRFKRASIVLVPTLVQGTQAAKEILTALNRAAELKDVEVIIIGRGGGSIEDLWAFNNEELAYAIRACPVPVISAVGHEVDFTIADFVADLRAATPSVAGELVVPLMDDLYAEISGQLDRLKMAMSHKLLGHKLELKDLSAKIQSPQSQLADRRLTLDHLSVQLNKLIADRIKYERAKTDNLNIMLQVFHPGREFERQRAKFLSLKLKLEQTIKLNYKLQKDKLSKLAITLEAISPLKVLTRGYSVVTDEHDNLISDATKLKKGQRIKAFLANGRFEAEVINTDQNGNLISKN